MPDYIVTCEQLKTADNKLYARGETVTLVGEEETTARRLGVVDEAPVATTPAVDAKPVPSTPAAPVVDAKPAAPKDDTNANAAASLTGSGK